MFFGRGLVAVVAVASDATEIIILLLSLSVLNEVSFLADLFEAVIVVDYSWTLLLQLMLLDLVVKLEALCFLVESL